MLNTKIFKFSVFFSKFVKCMKNNIPMRVPYTPPVMDTVLLDLENPVLDFSSGEPIILPSSEPYEYEDFR